MPGTLVDVLVSRVRADDTKVSPFSQGQRYLRLRHQALGLLDNPLWEGHTRVAGCSVVFAGSSRRKAEKEVGCGGISGWSGTR
jgi:hypothetical protein